MSGIELGETETETSRLVPDSGNRNTGPTVGILGTAKDKDRKNKVTYSATSSFLYTHSEASESGGLDEDTLHLIHARRARSGSIERRYTWPEYIWERCTVSYEWLRSNHVLVQAVVILMLSTTSERVIFKMSVDRMTNYRLSLAIAFVLASFAVYAAVSTYKWVFTSSITPRMWQFPMSKLAVMAMLDSISFVGLVVSAAGVTPTMTVILLHASTPIIVYSSQLVFPDRTYSALQIKGANFIAAAIAISVARSIIDMWYKQDMHNALSSVVYVLSASVAGVSTLYKEKAIIDWSQKMDLHFLSAGLFFLQSIYMLLFAVMLFAVQDMPFFTGMYDLHIRAGIRCFMKGISSTGPNSGCGDVIDAYYLNGDDANGTGHPTHSSSASSSSNYLSSAAAELSGCNCAGSALLVIGYVLSNVIVQEHVNTVLQQSNRILGRVMAASVFMAFLALGVYDNRVYSVEAIDVHIIGTIGIADILSIICLLVGIDLNGSDEEPNVDMITAFDPVIMDALGLDVEVTGTGTSDITGGGV